MARLPTNFPDDKLSVVEKIQLEWYYSKYVEEYYNDYCFGHMVLAAYAAVPAYITPDLLYRLWQNFGFYQWGGKRTLIHPVAVSDVLLAPFCKEVSYEVFRMDNNVRLSFLKWIQDDGLPLENSGNIIPEVAHFVEQYMQLPNDTLSREGEHYKKEQLMEAKAYYDPFAVAEEYLDQLNGAASETTRLSLINKLLLQKEKEAYVNLNRKALANTFNNKELDIWKHLIQDNKETIRDLLSEQFKNQLTNAFDNGFSITLNEEKASYALAIEENETEIKNLFDAQVESKTYVFIVPCSASDAPDCLRFQNFIEKISLKEKTIIETLDSKLTIKALPQLQDTLMKITPHDNLIIYTSSLNAVQEDDHCYLVYNKLYIKDSEAEEIFRQINPASFTLIIDGPDTYSPYWLNTEKPGYTLIANRGNTGSRRRRLPTSLAQRLEQVSVIPENEISFRDLFVRVCAQITGEGTTVPVVMASNRETYFQTFAGNKPLQKEVQHKLRLCGYLNTITGQWDEHTEYAFQQFLKDSNGSPNLYDAKNALDELLEKNHIEKKLVLLFIFSNNITNRTTLAEVYREINELKAIVKERALTNLFEIKIFHNRRLAEIDQFFKNADSRNRIQMVYYSGYDDNGNPLFNDGIIDLQKWTEWIYYQDRIELVVLNTCRSAILAEKLVNIGVGMAAGTYDVTYDDQAAKFGINIFRAIADQNFESLTFKD